EFKNGYNLRRHEAIHTGAKAGRVPSGAMKMPTMAFRDVYHLNRHKLSHSDEKPYQCPGPNPNPNVSPGRITSTVTSDKCTQQNGPSN
ncbi:hypothetical protein E2I00_008135, partial [Balaenoptera physalus]